MPDAALDERVTQFANYMVETYIADDARFPPSMWATSPSDEEDVPRTTNAADALQEATRHIPICIPSHLSYWMNT